MTELCRFCSVFDSVLSVSFTVPWHLLSQLAFAAQTDKMQVCQCPTIYHLPPVAGEYSLGGKNFHGFWHLHGNRAAHPSRAALAVMSSLQSLQHRTHVSGRLQTFLSCLMHSAFIKQGYCRLIHYSKQKPCGTSPKSGGWQMPNLGLNGTASFLLNPPLCIALGSHFFQGNSFLLDSRPAFLTCLIHSAKPGSTKQKNTSQKDCFALPSRPPRNTGQTQPPEYSLTTKSCSYYLPIKQATKCETILFWFR